MQGAVARWWDGCEAVHGEELQELRSELKGRCGGATNGGRPLNPGASICRFSTALSRAATRRNHKRR